MVDSSTDLRSRPATPSIADEGCSWRLEHADRVGVLIDGENYFRGVRQAMLTARERIIIVGWDLHTQTELAPAGVDDDLPTTLDPFLNALLDDRPGLQVYLLCWDFAMIYAMEREWAPVLTPTWLTHDRLHFEMDSKHPIGASQHQKLVIVDGDLAFCGGFDLSKWRWDTRQHRARERLRRDPEGKPYPPFHDIQLLVDGAAAQALAELACWRWQQATDEPLPAIAARDEATWPAGVEVWLREQRVGIARTLPRYGSQAEVREIESALVMMIGAAREAIYIENQYLTSDSIGKALCARLAAEDAPEIVVVLPEQTGAWLEKKTMDVLRSRILKRLRSADRQQRLRVCYPAIPGLDEGCLSVHSKLLIVDDRFVCHGSANLSNRSMGFDSECNLLIESCDQTTAEAILNLRDDLLGEHLGCGREAVTQARQQGLGLLACIDRLNGQERGLRRLDGELSEELERQLPDSRYIDPEQTIEPEKMIEQFWQRPSRAPVRRRVVTITSLLAALLGMAAIWRWTPLADYLDPAALQDLLAQLAPSPVTGLLVVTVFVLASLVSFPLTLMVAALALAFPPAWAFLYALCGAMLAAVTSYAIGASLGREAVRRWAGRRINRISRKVARRGILAVVFLRIVPLAPFTVINLVAGASHIRARDFILGSLLGLAPGLAVLTLFVDGVVSALKGSTSVNAGLLVLAALMLVGIVLLRIYLIRRHRLDNAESD